ncbi:Mis12 protein-domain-containing protein [Xylaria sp. FL1777]|nr:Mis12 protein-domain-containing protein [Xylaria sp. FL1777]
MSFASETELLTEHFGHPPVSLIDDIINSVNILAERALNSVEQGLLNAPPAALGFKAPKSQDAAAADSQPQHAERAKSEVEAGTHQLETLLCASIDRNFDKFELYVLRNIFTVRPPELCSWIRLSHYEGLDFSSSSASRQNDNSSSGNANHTIPTDMPTIESITALRRRLRESMRLNALLTAERARNDALLEDLRRLVGAPGSMAQQQVKTESSASPAAAAAADHSQDIIEASRGETKTPFAFLHQKGDLASSGGGAAAPLATTAAFTLSQTQALRALSTALSNVLPDLRASTADETADEDNNNNNSNNNSSNSQGPSAGGSRSWRRERAEYVGAATRRHLETMHGLELGRHGEVRDGEWQGPGRSLARGEAEGLERVVDMIGGDGDDDGGNGNGNGNDSGGAPRAAVPTDADGDRMDES